MPERYQLEVFMGMYDEKVVLCGANSYEEKYYLNPDDYTTVSYTHLTLPTT